MWTHRDGARQPGTGGGNAYAATRKAYSGAIERLRRLDNDAGACFRTFAEIGTSNRAREQSGIRLDQTLGHSELARVL